MVGSGGPRVNSPVLPRLPWPLSALHLFALILLAASLLTGLRLGVSHLLLPVSLSSLLPVGTVQTWHLWLGWAWAALIAGYALWAFQPGPRARRAAHYQRAGAHRWAVEASRWLLLALMLSGLLLYLRPAALGSAVSTPLAWLHVGAGLALIALLPLHLWASWPLGGWRLWLAALYPRQPRPHLRWLLHATALLVITALGALLLPVAWISPRLEIARIAEGAGPEIDGVLDESIWQRAAAQTVLTTRYDADHGGDIPVEIRALHDGATVFMALRWPDSTRSGAHLPLRKTADGWQLVQQGFAQDDEQLWYEDKLALMWARSHGLAGDSFQHGRRPRDVDPAPRHGRGYHYTDEAGRVDVWHWKALRNPLGTLDDSHFGAALPPQPGQRRYTAGYRADPAEAGAIVENWQWFDAERVLPRRLPRDPAQLAAFSELPDPRAPGAQIDWSLEWAATQPYAPELDTYPVGTLMPSILVRDHYEGDRGDVRARAHWNEGYWQLEIARSLAAPGAFDLPIEDGMALWIAVFDHSQTRHSLHLRPLIIALERP